MDKSVLANLQEAVVASKQTNIFGSQDTDQKVKDACVDYLKFYGYHVAEPKVFHKKIKNTRDLVEYFYLRLNSRDSKKFATSYNASRDMAVAKRFVESRMAVTGAGKDYTLNECGEIIRTIFDNYKDFNFKYDINFSVFGQGNLKWVTDKAIQIMNKKLEKKEEEYAEVLRRRALAHYGEPAGFSDLDDILRNMEEDKDG